MVISSFPRAHWTTAQRRAAFPWAVTSGLLALMGCASPAAAPEVEPALETAAYTARGNEPFWRLDVSDTGVTWRTPEGEISSEAPAFRAPTPVALGWRGFSADLAGGALMAEIRPAVCQDSMSGQTYPDTVSVTFQGQTFSGCGGAPMDLLVGSWRLATPAAGGQTPTLEIAADGRLSGFTGCNRMFGQMTVTGEGIAIGGIGTTRMACVDPAAAAQEQRIVQGLSSAQAFAIDDQGRLLLPAGPGEGQALTWTRVEP